MTPLVLLHGFGSTRRAWDDVSQWLDPERYRPLALDLPGHGEARAQRPINFVSCVRSVLGASPAQFDLCGYSLGGRIAQQVALAVPERVTRLILVSTSPGIERAGERFLRRMADRRLADELEHKPFEDFIERWGTQPLFAYDPAEVGARVCEDQRRNDPRALATAMRGIGTGEMEPLWGRLNELQMPVAIIVGDRDSKYRALANQMVARIPRATLTVIAGGHRLPIESPQGLAQALEASS